jgi:hypothetical protein
MPFFILHAICRCIEEYEKYAPGLKHYAPATLSPVAFSGWCISFTAALESSLPVLIEHNSDSRILFQPILFGSLG